MSELPADLAQGPSEGTGHARPADLLGVDGPFAEGLAHFAPRQAQQDMAEAVAEAIHAYETLLVEAGTGVGKTYAYLVPAVLAGRKVLVSTGTKALQDQLFYKDLPAVLERLGVGIKTALLKGRANYLCRYRLDQAEQQRGLELDGQGRQLAEVVRWAALTATGDRAEVSTIPEDAAIWPLVTSTSDNCLGSECPEYGRCFVVKARRAAQEADLVVINHHLLCADMALKEEGFGEVLPHVQAVIVDEAHQLPEVGAAFFGVSLSARQLRELARDTAAAAAEEAADAQELVDALAALERAVDAARAACGPAGQRVPWASLSERPEVPAAFAAVDAALGEIERLLEIHGARGAGLEAATRRTSELRERMALFATEQPDYVAWIETYTRAFILHLTPINVGDTFAERRRSLRCAWIYTSATLAAAGRFDHFAERVGLAEDDYLGMCLDSPFDYARNALLYLPKGLPEPTAANHVPALIEALCPLLGACPGGVFLLFTSYRALEQARSELDRRGLAGETPVLVQGEAPRGELIERFRTHGRSILLGTGSFWEGVDVRGAALSCVVIDRLPFASPADPVLAARIDEARRQGHQPFQTLQLPHAILTLKQGAGRLIRDRSDRGLLVIGDTRLVSRPYGRLFLESLPAMGRTRSQQRAVRFFGAGVDAIEAAGDGR